MSQSTHTSNHANRKAHVITWSVLTASSLALLKLSVGLLSRSMALIASAVDSLTDVLVSVVNLLSLREADKPADAEHAFGHGKIESLASLFQSILIGASGIFLIVESIRRWLRNEPIVMIHAAIVVMVISIVLTFLHTRRLTKVARETESMIVETEKVHFSTDLWTNTGVIIALLLVQWTGAIIWDILIALVVAVYILKQSYMLLRKSVDELIDRALPEELQNQIRHTILHFDKRVLGVHNLRTRRLGHVKFIEFHVELDKSMSFETAHNLTEDLIDEVKRQIPDSDVNAHFDPEGGR